MAGRDKRSGLLPAWRRRLLTSPDLTGLSLVHFSENSIESSDAAKAGAKGDLRQRQVGLVNEPLGPLHAHGLGNIRRTRSDVLLKQPAQMTGADSKPGGDFFDTDRSEWDWETFTEAPRDLERTRRLFAEANERWKATK